MPALYEVVFKKPTGEHVTTACNHDFLSMDYTLRLNTIGQLSITLPSDRYPASIFGEDYRIEIWRKPKKGMNYLEGETCWFITHLEATRRLTEIHAVTANCLLDRRVVAYQDGINEANVKKFGHLDDMLKAAVRENTGVGTTASYNHGAPDTMRFLTPYFTVQGNTSSWPDDPGGRRITHDKLYKVAQNNADKANHYAPDTYFFFDVVQIQHDGVTNPFLELRTYTGQRGADQRGFVVFSEEEKTLTNVKLFLDWGDATTRIYAGGPGTGATRVFGTADIPDLITALQVNPFGLREKFVIAKKTTNLTETQQYAISNLANKDNKPYRQIQGALTEAICNLYGMDFFFGDRVGVQFLGQSFDTFVNPVHVHIENQSEQLDIQVTEKVNLYVSDLAAQIRQVNQLKRRIDELETIDSY